MRLWQTSIQTRWGTFTAGFSERGLAQLRFPAPDSSALEADRPGPVVSENREAPAGMQRWHTITAHALEVLLTGGTGSPEFPPLAPEPGGTPFQESVWTALRGIPPGAVLTYGELARQLGRPRAARAVGQACGANPLPVFIPCHRVLAADGTLGGFSAGLAWKQRLLAVEGRSR